MNHNILIDIGHPAHVHYFRNFIQIMQEKGHKVLVIARNREVIHELLVSYNIKFISRGKGSKFILGKIIYTFWADLLLIFHSIKFRPNLFLSHGSHYTMHVARLFNKPCISTGDSDHIKMNAKFLMPYLSCLLTPDVYKLDYGENHLRFSGYMELLYLHPRRFLYDKREIRRILDVSDTEKYFVIRFVAWNSFHDSGQVGITTSTKIKLVKLLSEKGKVFISSEIELPDELKRYQINFAANYLHAAIAEADLCISEGATTASESAVLGTPTIYINSLDVSYCSEQEKKYQLTYGYRNELGLIEKVIELLNNENLKKIHKERKDKMISEKIDVTAFLVWFIENYPSSYFVCQENPNYQLKFR